MIAVKTIGNATLVAIDGKPVLATDPWFDEDSAYFGSWRLTHQVPAAERDDIAACAFVWFSHAHPDHLNPAALDRLAGKTILLADHVGGRMARELRQAGFKLRVMPDRRWVQLSAHIKVLSIADYNQDSILLVDVYGRLFINLNDAVDRGWGRFVRQTAKQYRAAYLLASAGNGEAGAMNFFAEDGHRLVPIGGRRLNGAARLARTARRLGATHIVPFSNMHTHQRADSLWANDIGASTPPTKLTGNAALLPAFAAIDCLTGEVHEIDPPALEGPAIPPERFGDCWSDRLEPADARLADNYFRAQDSLARLVGFVTLRVGGADHRIALNPSLASGLTFEVPRTSLMAALHHRVFDDLLMGNFMKTTLHGIANVTPELPAIIAKYADFGGAMSRAELKAYFTAYRRRAWLDHVIHALEQRTAMRLGKHLGKRRGGLTAGRPLTFDLGQRAPLTLKQVR